MRSPNPLQIVARGKGGSTLGFGHGDKIKGGLNEGLCRGQSEVWGWV